MIQVLGIEAKADSKQKMTAQTRKMLRCIREFGKLGQKARIQADGKAVGTILNQTQAQIWQTLVKIDQGSTRLIDQQDVKDCRNKLEKVKNGESLPAFDLDLYVQGSEKDAKRAMRVSQIASQLIYDRAADCVSISGQVAFGLGVELGAGARVAACKSQLYSRYLAVSVTGSSGIGFGISAIASVNLEDEFDDFQKFKLAGQMDDADSWAGFGLALSGSRSTQKAYDSVGLGVGFGVGYRDTFGAGLKILPLGIAYRSMLNDLTREN